MKGIIDVTIKRKDGTEEHQHLHNVVFDYPSLVYKKLFENNKLSIFTVESSSFYMSSSSVQNRFKLFSLSEEECDLTYPKFVPKTLITSTSSTSVWYSAPLTSSISDKKITRSATWTIGEALTIKSIFFDGSINPCESCLCVYDMIYNNHLHNHRDILYGNREDSNSYKISLDSSNYKFTNEYLQGLSSGNNISADVLFYDLANSNEVAAYTSSANVKNCTVYPSYASDSKIGIFNKTTDTLIRSFTLTDFSEYKSSNYTHTYLLNTGTKNWLFQKNPSSAGFTIWQIPDTQTTGTINYTSNTFLSTYATNTNLGSNHFIIGNYVCIKSDNNTISDILKIDDSLNVVEYKGYSKSGIYYNYSYTDYQGKWSINNQGIYLRMDDTSDGRIVPYITNYTAANFATPLSLSADDVLTISYSIEVD